MPFYRYECEDCHKTTEVFQKMSEEPLEVCPLCGGRLKKMVNTVGVVFKGNGYYSTDSKKTSTAKTCSTSSKTD